jgi:peroxiredoxin
MVGVGDKAPNFTLKNTSKEEVSLSDYQGEAVILAFYPGAFTGVCDKEMCSLQDNLSELNTVGAKVIGISVDSPWANGEFARKYEIEFELLSDLDREVIDLYDAKFVGLGGLEGYVSANRAIVIVDPKGFVKYRWVAENPGIEPDYQQIVSICGP